MSDAPSSRGPAGPRLGRVAATVLTVILSCLVSACGGSTPTIRSAAQPRTPASVAPISLTPVPAAKGPAAPSTPAPSAAATQAAQPLVSAAPVTALGTRITPDVFVRLPAPVTAGELTKLTMATSATTAVVVAVGEVGLGAGRTVALGVNPSTFRTITPAGTAESAPLWQAVADGSVAVAHTVAKALGVTLGGDTVITPQPAAATPSDSSAQTAPSAAPSAAPSTAPAAAGGPSVAFRVGALATTGLPGVGLIVDNRYNVSLGLRPMTGVVLAAPGHDPVVTAALAQQVLGAGVTATALRVPVTDTGALTWVAPAVGPITAGFGYRESPIFPGQREFHGGIDIGAPLGAPIYAASAGSVVYAGPAQGFGNEVVLQHAGGVETVYGHMERILVTAGAPVTAGEPIALVGSEGESTGPHLHFEVHVNGDYTDPLAWLTAHGVTVTR